MKLRRENDRLQLSLHEVQQKLIKMQNKESEELRQLRSENKAMKIFLNEKRWKCRAVINIMQNKLRIKRI